MTSIDWLSLAPYAIGVLVAVFVLLGIKHLVAARQLVGDGHRQEQHDAFYAFGLATMLFLYLIYTYPAFRLAVGVAAVMLLLLAAVALKYLQDAGKLPRYNQRRHK